MRKLVLGCVGSIALAHAACDAPAREPAPEPERVPAAAKSAAASAAPHEAPPLASKPALVPGATPVAPFVSELIAAQPDAKTIVYVGASWCEPCQRFHDALQAGALDAELRGVRFVEYDLDKHKAELAADGYASRLIPLFAIPAPDGRCSARTMQGSIKGESAVQLNLLPRLRELLSESAAARVH